MGELQCQIHQCVHQSNHVIDKMGMIHSVRVDYNDTIHLFYKLDIRIGHNDCGKNTLELGEPLLVLDCHDDG